MFDRSCKLYEEILRKKQAVPIIIPSSCGKAFNVSKRQDIWKEGVSMGTVYYIVTKVLV